MPGKAAKVVITERQQKILLLLSRSRSVDQRCAQRATIVLRAFEGLQNRDIAQQVGLNAHQIGLWRRRWQQTWESLTLLECTDTRRLRAAIEETLSDAPRSGSPGKFTAEQVTEIIALACEPPEKCGRPITQWTARELRDEVLKKRLSTRFRNRMLLGSCPQRR